MHAAANKSQRSAARLPLVMIGAAAALLVIWQLFLIQNLGLPASVNFWITVSLYVLCGLTAIAGISTTLLESITLDRSQVRIRSPFGFTSAYDYDEIESIVPVGDRVNVVFRDGGRISIKNLRLGDGLEMSRLSSFLQEKSGTASGISIYHAD